MRFLILAVAVILVQLGAPSLAHAQPADNGNDWTFLIYMNGKNNLEPFAIENFQDLASVGSSARAKFVVQMGRPYSRRPADPMRNAYEGWSGAKRYLVKAGQSPGTNDAVMTLTTPQVDMGDPQTLEDFLRWGKTTYPAKRYVVVIWNHGAGYRLFMASAAKAPLGGASLDASKQSASVLNGSNTYRSISFDDDTGSMLYNVDVRDVIAHVFTRDEVALVGFDACLMSMIETAYELRTVTPIIAGSEELEPGEGWDYAYVAQAMKDKPGVSDADVARMLVEMYKTRYVNSGEATTFSAIDLEKIPALANLLSGLADSLVAELSTRRTSIDVARAGQEAYNSTGLYKNPVSVDLDKFLDLLEQQLKKASNTAKLVDQVQKARVALRAVVFANYRSVSREGKWGSNGLAFYFPRTAADRLKDPESDGYRKSNKNKPIAFVADHKWADFLSAYLGPWP